MAITREARDWTKEVKEPDARKVFEALADDRWDFRTLDGIAETTGLSPERVREVLNKYQPFIRQSLVLDRRGRELYTLASRRPSFQEWLSTTRAVISKSTSTE